MNKFTAGTFVRAVKLRGNKISTGVPTGIPYIGTLDIDVVEGGRLMLGVKGVLGDLHYLLTTSISKISLSGKRAFVTTANSTYQVEILKKPYKLRPGDLHS